MKHLIISLSAFAGLTMTASAQSFESAREFMQGYTDTWNEHDTASLAENYWAMRPTVEEEKAGLDATFARLKEQGYEKSTIHQIEICFTGPTTAWSGLKFTRNKTDGTPLGPDPQATNYSLEWQPDIAEWRVKGITGQPGEDPLVCPE
ncbi:MAG: hypothetical protein CMK09_14980 [Ponticaulis sp.]|nr:hypothetical protein [Ponticaulis sp.]|tara:strand:- start:51451 stop:51894 length:444 start_codon:yes stop_codon:yes gene_type:complete